MTEAQGTELIDSMAVLTSTLVDVGNVAMVGAMCVGLLLGVKLWEVVRYALRAKDFI